MNAGAPSCIWGGGVGGGGGVEVYEVESGLI